MKETFSLEYLVNRKEIIKLFVINIKCVKIKEVVFFSSLSLELIFTITLSGKYLEVKIEEGITKRRLYG